MKFKDLKPGDIFCTKPARYMKTHNNTGLVIMSSLRSVGDEYEFEDDFEYFVPIYVADEQEEMLQVLKEITDCYFNNTSGWGESDEEIYQRAKKILDNNGF